MSTNPLSNLKIDKWHHALLVISAVVFILSLTIKLEGISNSFVQLLSLGSIFIGIGEWINHPLQTELRSNLKITHHNRINTWPGNMWNALGLIIIFYGLWSHNDAVLAGNAQTYDNEQKAILKCTYTYNQTKEYYYSQSIENKYEFTLKVLQKSYGEKVAKEYSSERNKLLTNEKGMDQFFNSTLMEITEACVKAATNEKLENDSIMTDNSN